MGHLVFLVYHPHGIENSVDALVALLPLAPACRLEHKLQVLLHGAVVKKLEVLEYDAHLLAQRGHRLALDVVDVVSQYDGLRRIVVVELAIQGLEK